MDSITPITCLVRKPVLLASDGFSRIFEYRMLVNSPIYQVQVEIKSWPHFMVVIPFETKFP